MLPPSCCRTKRPARCRDDRGPDGCSWSPAARAGAAWCNRDGARWREATKSRCSTRDGGWGYRGVFARRASNPRATPQARRIVFCSFVRFPKRTRWRFAFRSIRSTGASARERLALPAPATVGSPPRLAAPSFGRDVPDANPKLVAASADSKSFACHSPAGRILTLSAGGTEAAGSFHNRINLSNNA